MLKPSRFLIAIYDEQTMLVSEAKIIGPTTEDNAVHVATNRALEISKNDPTTTYVYYLIDFEDQVSTNKKFKNGMFAS